MCVCAIMSIRRNATVYLKTIASRNYKTPVTLILLTLASETSTDRNVPSRMRKKTHYVYNCVRHAYTGHGEWQRMRMHYLLR